MDPDLRSQLNVLLINGGHDKNGEATTFPVLMRQILDEVRRETSASEPRLAYAARDGNGAEATNNGAGGPSVQVNGGASKKSAGPGPGEASNLNRETTTSLAVPAAVVEEALQVTREVLREVAEFEDDSNGAT